MQYYFPPQNQNFKYLQSNRSNELGSIWSSFNLDFQKELNTMMLAKKLVTNTSSSDQAGLETPSAFEFAFGRWWATCGKYIYVSTGDLLTNSFSVDTSGTAVGDSTTQFDITNISGSTFRYTYDGTGTNPSINATNFPIGSTVYLWADNFSAGNQGNFTVTASGSNYFQVTNVAGVVESNKTIATGFIAVYGGALGADFDFNDSDLAVFNDRIWAAGNKLYSKDRHYDAVGGYGAWTKKDTLGNGIHKMVYFKKFDRLYYVDDANTISSINVNDTVVNSLGDYFLDLIDNFLIISAMKSSSGAIWIGTRRMDSDGGTNGGTNCYIYEWDGISPQVTKEYKIEAGAIMSMCVLNDIPYAIDSDGRILKYTGYSFEEIQRFPLKNILFVNSTSNTNNYYVHFNGMEATKNNTLLIAITNLNTQSSQEENIPSGVWELDLNTLNFTHKHSFTLKTMNSATVTDFGQNKISVIGALKVNTLVDSSTAGRATLFVGAKYFSDATTQKYGIFIDSPSNPTATDYEGQKRGYFVTTWFESIEIVENWLKLWATYKKFNNVTDKMIFKYRFVEESAVLADITWVNTTSFTTTTNITAYDPALFDGITGGEVEILQGTGGGACVHITNISEAAGTYTVTIDNGVTGVTTGTAKARFQKWIKLGEIAGTVLQYAQFPITKSDVKIQIKGVLEWTGDGEFNRTILVTGKDININS